VVDRVELLTLVHTAAFDDAAARLFTVEQASDLAIHLALRPTSGVLIPGAGGIRKLRWAAKGRASVAAPE
jgi:hypothetical protein